MATLKSVTGARFMHDFSSLWIVFGLIFFQYEH